jgi:hypothetical protein
MRESYSTRSKSSAGKADDSEISRSTVIWSHFTGDVEVFIA